MTDTTFVDQQTVVPVAWLQDVNNTVYRATTAPVAGGWYSYNFGRTAAEIAASVTPSNYAYFEGQAKRYGVAGNSDGTAGVGTDDTVALRRLAAVIQAGAKVLDFQGLRMRCFGDGTTTTLFPLTSLNGLTIRHSGAQFVVDRTFTGSQTVDLFIMTACSNVTAVDSPRMKCTQSQPANQHTSRGPQFLSLLQGCSNITFPGADAEDFRQVWHFSRLSTDPESYASRGLRFGTTKAYRCGYPMSGSLSGYGVEALILSEECGRSYFCTGGIMHRIGVYAKNNQASIDCLITTDQGLGMNDLILYYDNTESTTSDNSLNCTNVQYQEGDLYVGTHRNIHITVNIKNASAGVYLGFCCGFSKLKADDTADTVDRGHVLENFSLHGTVAGASANQRSWATTQGTFGAGDNFSNLCFEKLRFNSLGQPNFLLAALKDVATFRDFYCSATVNLTASSTAGTRVDASSCVVNAWAVSGGLFYNHDEVEVGVTYSASMTLDAATGKRFVVSVSNGTAFAFAFTNFSKGDSKKLTLRNNSGGAMGAITATGCKAVVTAAATGFSRTYEFTHDGTNAIHTGGTFADIPN